MKCVCPQLQRLKIDEQTEGDMHSTHSCMDEKSQQRNDNIAVELRTGSNPNTWNALHSYSHAVDDELL